MLDRRITSPAVAVLFLLASGPPVSSQSAGDTQEHPIPGTDATIRTAFVPEGTFRLGSPTETPGRGEDEGPQVSVVVSAFHMMIHEVSQAEFAIFRNRRLDSPATSDPGRTLDIDAVTRPSPPYEDPAHSMGGPEGPATGMTQWAALQYARWLSMKTGRIWRLPTEAEWEYACRLGRENRSEVLGDVAWFIDNSGEETHAVGTRAPDGLGIHDLLGNAAEWTMDQYRADFYGSLSPDTRDPWAVPDAAHPRTVRGGAFDDEAAALRCEARTESTLRWKRRDPQIPKSRWWNTDSPHVGFRLVTPDGEHTLAEVEAYWGEVLGN